MKKILEYLLTVSIVMFAIGVYVTSFWVIPIQFFNFNVLSCIALHFLIVITSGGICLWFTKVEDNNF